MGGDYRFLYRAHLNYNLEGHTSYPVCRYMPLISMPSHASSPCLHMPPPHAFAYLFPMRSPTSSPSDNPPNNYHDARKAHPSLPQPLHLRVTFVDHDNMTTSLRLEQVCVCLCVCVCTCMSVLTYICSVESLQ